jgi:hypothetical protein
MWSREQVGDAVAIAAGNFVLLRGGSAGLQFSVPTT